MENTYVNGGDPAAEWKRAAARIAVAEVPDGAVLGLGSGSTAELMLEELAGRVRQGLRVTGVATSERTRMLAAGLGIPLLELDEAHALDMSIDGADEVILPQLDVLKGRGGALLREKLVAAASRRRVIIVDSRKLVPALGIGNAIPVEVAPFGWTHTARRLAALGCHPVRRPAPGQEHLGDAATPFLSDGGHYILDCAIGPITDAAAFGQAIKSQIGVIEHGLFVGMTERLVVAGADGVRVYDRPA